MIQLSYKISPKRKLIDSIKEVKANPLYEKATCILAQLFMGMPDIEKTEKLIAELKKEIPQIKIAGMTTNGCFNKTACDNSEDLITFMIFERNEAEVLSYDTQTENYEEIAKDINFKINNTENIAGAQFMMDTMQMIEPERIFNNIQSKNPTFQFFGAVAGTPENIDKQTFFVFSDKIYKKGGIIVIIYKGKDILIKTNYNLGWKAVGREFTVTKTNGLYGLQELDNTPVLEIYKHYLRQHLKNETLKDIIDFPIILKRDGLEIIRGIVGLKNGEVKTAADIHEGEKVRLAFGNLSDIRKGDEYGACEMGTFHPEALFLTICENRRSYLKGEEQFEINCYRQAFDSLYGCCAFGEIIGANGRPQMLNCALVVAGIREGKDEVEVNANNICRIWRDSKIQSTLPLLDRLCTFLESATEDYVQLQEKEKERELQNEVLVQKASNQAKSAFLANMSHEIRTPINAVLGLDEMILRECKDPIIIDYADKIKSAGHSLLSLINDILDFSKIKSGKMSIINSEYDLSSTLNDLLNMIKQRAEKKGLKLIINVDPSIPRTLFGDEVHIKQCVINILTNAVKYTKKGSVTMNVSWRKADEEHIFLRYRIIDTGIGIKQEDIAKLFKAFERIDEKKNSNIEGTGLGMNIVKNLLTMMNTELEVKSEYGKGSDFSFEVKQNIVDNKPIGDFIKNYQKLSNKNTKYKESFQAANAHILAIDDTEINLTVLKNLLKQTLIKIDTASSGIEAIELAVENKYDMIFIDHRMPIMDGIETLHALKKLEKNANSTIPCIALTANAVVGAKEMYLEEGFTDYLTKPIDSKKLEDMLIKYLPKELITKTKKNENEPLSEEEKNFELQYSNIQGVEKNIAIENCSSVAVLKQAVEGFYDSIESKAKEIEEAIISHDIKTYTVKVHALKSSARLIGASFLSTEAAYLEKCGDNNDFEAIEKLTPSLLALYRSYKIRLAELFQKNDNSSVIEKEKYEEALSALKESILAFDYDSADQIIKMLKEYTLPESEKERFLKIKKAVADIDRESILNLLE